QSALLVMAIASGKTAWYWLTFGSVLAFLACEAVANLVWNSRRAVTATFPVLALAVMLMLAWIGLTGQLTFWQLGITGMEARLAKLKEAEQAKAAQAEAEERRAQAERRRREEEWALERQRAEKELEQERERQRLAQEQLRIEAERAARDRQQ